MDESGDSYAPGSPEHTLLYRVVREQLEPFLDRARLRERPAPHFVEQELRAFLQCGVLAHGFLRLHCDDCGHDLKSPANGVIDRMLVLGPREKPA
jgi:hypothetical protein